MVDMRWSNLAGSLTWGHDFRGLSSSQTTLYATSYQTNNDINISGLNIAYLGHIRHVGLRQNFQLMLGRHELNIGAQTMITDVKTAEWTRVNNHEKEQRKGWDNSAWLNWQFSPIRQLSASAGMRLTVFSEKCFVKTHVTIEPRISLAWQPSEWMSIKAGYSRTSQNIHALRNQNTTTPFDRYTISSKLVKPEVADQVSLGLFIMTPSQDYDFSLEGYYRHIDNVLDYRDGISFSSAIEIERAPARTKAN